MAESTTSTRRKQPKRRKAATNGSPTEAPSVDVKSQPPATTLPKCLASQDVMLSVQRFLEPLDLMTLRKTCKTWYAHSKSRIVWIQAIERMCLRNGVRKAWFPLEDMSLPDLEHLALSPSRFLSLLKRHNHGTIRPPSIRILNPQVAQTNLTVKTVFLVPGGRYLVAAYTDNSDIQSASLWDLGCGTTMPLKLAPVAQFTFPAGFCISEINLSQDGATILLNGIRKIEAQNASSAQVYTLQPDSEDPQFKLQGELKNLRLDTDPLGLCDDLFCLGIDGELVVWNVREGTACRWQGTDNMYHVLLFKDAVVTLDDSENTPTMRLYEIPPLQPHLDDLNSVPITINPPTFNFVRANQPFDYAFLRSPTWTCHGLSRPYFMLLDLYFAFPENHDMAIPGSGDPHASRRNGWGLELYSLARGTLEDDRGLGQSPRIRIPIRVGTVDNYVGPSWSGNTPLYSPQDTTRYTENYFVFHSYQSRSTSTSRSIAISSVPASNPEPFTPWTVFVNARPPEDDTTPDRCSLCPVTGRMVFVSKDAHDFADDIRIMDFLVSPSQL
ncbi:hypothetical protein CC2G_013697 [Coprinopsis cinerea AmutBmut pab1-1]|nr:hypothetical protein CC2G_013697 [Coprinopsis cinerea AmutBmut pab1-1]